MLHFMVDAYGATQAKLDALSSVNEVLNKLVNLSGLAAVMPPMLLPYYYCEERDDGGISAFVILSGGHVTIHTFPYRECYFVDVLYDGFFDSDKFLANLRAELPASQVKSYLTDRRFDIEKAGEVDSGSDFGPHFLCRAKPGQLTMEGIYGALERLPYRIDMQPIMRPYVIFDRADSPTYLSGITLIAQSHIAVHYNLAEKIAYIDIFSCSFVESGVMRSELKRFFGPDAEFKLISRGSKHAARRTASDTLSARYNSWAARIRNKD